MIIYLVFRYFAEVKEQCPIKAFEKEEDAMNFKNKRSKMVQDYAPEDYFFISPIHLVK